MSSPSKPKLGMEVTSPASPALSAPGYPFPRAFSSGKPTTRRTSTSSITSYNSIAGNGELLGQQTEHVHEASQNSIASLLRPPILRTGLLPHTQATAAATGYRAPTTRDIPPVALTNIPHVPPEEFRDYINRIEPLFESFRRLRQEQDQPGWIRKDNAPEDSRPSSRHGEDGPQSPRYSRQSSLIGSPTPGERASPRRRSSGQLRRNRNEPTPLSTIPDVYFETGFHLENPRTFDIVSERSEIVQPLPAAAENGALSTSSTSALPRKSLATNSILQEKLSWYMDTVEVNLINNISTASAGFFAALGSLKELQDEAAQSVQRIQGLRADLKRLDEEVALRGLEVIARKKRAANLRKLAKAITQIEAVVSHITKADDAVDEDQLDDAADQMDCVASLICGLPTDGWTSEDIIDLRKLRAFQAIDSSLRELQYRIGSGFGLRFTRTLIADLQKHVEKVPRMETVKRWARQRGIPPTYMEVDEQFRKDVLAALRGLQRAGHVRPATASYRDAINREMKNLIRKYLPSSTDDDADSMISTSTRGGQRLSQQEKSSILARNLRALDATDAEALLNNIYTSLSEALRRVSTQVKVLLDVTSSMQTPETKSPIASAGLPSLSSPMGMTNATESPPFDDMTQALDMSSLLGQAVDTAQTQISRILKVRNEQTTRLSKTEFMRYFHLNRLFADECEAVSGRGGQTLRAVIDAQITGFVQALGSSETERIANLLDKDEWNAVDFDAKDDAILRRILDSVSADPPSWTFGAGELWQESATRRVEADPSSTSATETTTNGKTGVKSAHIDEANFILVRSTTVLLESIETLLSLTASISSLTPTIANSLLEVLRTFNSRSCQLILGAGATRSAGLKNITTKHLALASQSLSFVAALIPYLRECIRRHLPFNQLNVLADFDKTKRLYQEHQSGIHEKLVDIMASRCQAHVKSMKAINFDSDTSDEPKVSPYMDTLTKETLTLHRVLSRHLGAVDLDMIIRQIAANYRTQWLQAFGEIFPTTVGGKARLLGDAECFRARLSKIPEFDGIGNDIVAAVKAKVDGGSHPKKPTTSKDKDKNVSASLPASKPAEVSAEKRAVKVLFDGTSGEAAAQTTVDDRPAVNGKSDEHSLSAK